MRLLIFVTFALPCFFITSVGQSSAPVLDDPDAYAVYSTIIPDEWPVRAANAHNLVIEAKTTGYVLIGERKEKLCLKPSHADEATLGPLIKAYEEANNQAFLLQRNFSLSQQYQIVPRESIAALFEGKGPEGWKNFYARYPDSGGHIHLSAVGFNADKTLALVYAGNWCQALCGGGRYHLLKKTDNKWAEIPWRGDSCSWAS